MLWQRLNIGSRVSREVHARFWESPEVKALRATRHPEKNLQGAQDGRVYLSSGQYGEIGRAQIAYFRCTLSFKPILLAQEFSESGQVRNMTNADGHMARAS